MFKNVKILPVLETAAVLVVFILWSCAWCSKAGKKQISNIDMNLTLRLGAEWQKIKMLRRESASIGDVFQSMRELELYPLSLTGFDSEKIKKYEKAIENLENQNRNIEKRIDALKVSLVDAISILRQLIIGEPVERMFATLEKGNLKRITEMLNIKHSIDTLWLRTDSLLSSVMNSIGIDNGKKTREEAEEDEFSSILRANLGMQAENCYSRLNAVKKHLIRKASHTQLSEMFRIERQNILVYIEEKPPVAGRKINDAIELFNHLIDIDELYLLMVQVRFREGSYREALATLESVPDDERYETAKILYKLQSFYALKEYDSILADTSLLYGNRLYGSYRNLALWIILESSLALKKYDIAIKAASLVDKESSFGLHALHAVARAYIGRKDYGAALKVLDQYKGYKVSTDDDRRAFEEIGVAKAHILYELGEYDKALELYYKHISNSRVFERALSGIIWCYLKSGKFDKAETALKKLINQSPESPYGAEGLLILAKRYLQKASFTWKKHNQITAEKLRLGRILSRLDTLSFSSADNKVYDFNSIRKEVTDLLCRVEEEKLPDYKTISAYYDKIDRICAFIKSHYHTGSFQEEVFSENRKRILTVIDSLTMEIKQSERKKGSGNLLSNALNERLKIKNIVDQAEIFSVIGNINRYRWEREYIEWQKSLLKSDKNLKYLTESYKGSDTLSEAEKIKINKRMDSLLAVEDSLNIEYSTLLRAGIEKLLSAGLDKKDVCYFKYLLGEIVYRAENNRYAAAFEKYEKELENFNAAMERYRNGEMMEMPEKPATPILYHNESMALYRQAIDADPSSEFCAAAHYALAWCFNDLGQFDSAYYHMYILASGFPEHPYAPQAWMFCGEYHFDKGNLSDALNAYYTVMKYPASEWFDEALYKVAWTQYRLSNPEKAISSFLALVDLGGGRTGRSLLEKESMDYIAISFSETDMSGQKGLDRAVAFAGRLGDVRRGCEILHRLAQVFRDQGRYDMAKKTYSYILSSFPDYDNNPLVEAEFLAILERDGVSPMLIDRKYSYFRKYNRQSAWAKRQPDSVRTFSDSLASRMLYDAAISYHQLALQKNSDTLYNKALSSYKDYIVSYPASPLANECHYNLAEIEFSLGNYLKAAEEYMAVSKRYPDSKYKETAAWNAIVASQNLLKLESHNKR